MGQERGRYSIADISLLGWVSLYRFAAISIDDFPAIKAWLARCGERPAVQRGFAVPKVNELQAYQPETAEMVAKQLELKNVVDAAKAQYGYKYSFP